MAAEQREPQRERESARAHERESARARPARARRTRATARADGGMVLVRAPSAQACDRLRVGMVAPVLVTAFLHLKQGMLQPPLFGAALGLKQMLFDEPVIQIHVFGRADGRASTPVDAARAGVLKAMQAAAERKAAERAATRGGPRRRGSRRRRRRRCGSLLPLGFEEDTDWQPAPRAEDDDDGAGGDAAAGDEVAAADDGDAADKAATDAPSDDGEDAPDAPVEAVDAGPPTRRAKKMATLRPAPRRASTLRWGHKRTRRMEVPPRAVPPRLAPPRMTPGRRRPLHAAVYTRPPHAATCLHP